MAVTAEDTDNRALIAIARQSIEYRLQYGCPWAPDEATCPPAWRQKRATFVTLFYHGQLRGCIGTTEAVDPLVCSIAHNARAAAFDDPRFPPLTLAEYAGIEVNLSLLTPAEAMQFADEDDLLAQLVPGHDGLIIEYGKQRATFLPTVWENLPHPGQFLSVLKEKGDLPHDKPPERAWRYRTITVME